MGHKNLSILVFFTVGTGIFLLLLSRPFNMTVVQLISSFNQALFYRNHNICPAGEVNTMNVMLLIYQASIFLFFLSLTVKKFVRPKKYNLFAYMRITDILTQVAFFMLSLSMISQTLNFSLSAKISLKDYADLSTDQKYEKLLGDKYAFSQFIHQSLPERSTLGVLSENNNIPPGEQMTTHRQLAYFLYPLDMRAVRKEDTNAYIIIDTHAPEELIPEGYQLLGRFNKNNIVAIKKTP